MGVRDGIKSVNRNVDLTGRVPDLSPTVSMYHSVGVEGGYDDVSRAEFRKHVEWLDARYDIVDLPAVFDASRIGNGKVAITFDDGLESFYRNAMPVLSEFDAPATLFVPAALVDPTGRMGVDRLRTDRLETPETILSRARLEEIAENPLVTIGGHTWTHPELPSVHDPEVLDREIVDSKRVLESELGVPIDRFAYPYNEWDERSLERVRATYSYAVCGNGVDERITSTTDPHLIPRTSGGVELDRLQFHVSDVGKAIVKVGERFYG